MPAGYGSPYAGFLPQWDLHTMLDSLKGPAFEPLDQTDLEILSLERALLLALTSAKRDGEIHFL